MCNRRQTWLAGLALACANLTAQGDFFSERTTLRTQTTTAIPIQLKLEEPTDFSVSPEGVVALLEQPFATTNHPVSFVRVRALRQGAFMWDKLSVGVEFLGDNTPLPEQRDNLRLVLPDGTRLAPVNSVTRRAAWVPVRPPIVQRPRNQAAAHNHTNPRQERKDLAFRRRGR